MSDEKIRAHLDRIAHLQREIGMVSDGAARWYRWKEIEMRFSCLALIAKQEGARAYPAQDA